VTQEAPEPLTADELTELSAALIGLAADGLRRSLGQADDWLRLQRRVMAVRDWMLAGEGKDGGRERV
jgi:hypothetical protein